MRHLAVLLLLIPAALTATAAPRPAWISGCSSWKHTSNSAGYSAYCSGGNARYMAKATCYGQGGYRMDYGTYVWPRNMSTGSCPAGTYVTSTGWTQ